MDKLFFRIVFLLVLFAVFFVSCSEHITADMLIPQGLEGAFNGDTVVLTWDGTILGTEEGYLVWRRLLGDDDYECIGLCPPGYLRLEDDDIEVNQLYGYKIEAIFPRYGEDFSSYVEVSTELLAPIILSIYYDGSSVVLSWEAGGESEPDGFEIWRSVGDNSNYQILPMGDLNSTIYYDKNVEVFETYFYKIRAVYTLGNSVFCEEVHIKVGEYSYAGSWTFGDSYHAPRAVSSAPNGDVYVADAFDSKVYYFTRDGGYLGEWSYSGDSAMDIAVSADGSKVYVSDSGFCRVYIFSYDGIYLGLVGTGNPGAGEGDFYYQFGVAVAPNGNVYVSDMQNHRVQYFTSDGDYIGQWGDLGSGVGQFDTPYGIGIASNGDVYVCEWTNSRVQYFTSTGDYLGHWGSYGSGEGQFDGPFCVDVSPPTGDCFVAEYDRIQYFSPSGLYKGDVGFSGAGYGGFASNGGICVSPTGDRVYVGDHVSNSVHYYDKIGITPFF